LQVTATSQPRRWSLTGSCCFPDWRRRSRS